MYGISTAYTVCRLFVFENLPQLYEKLKVIIGTARLYCKTYYQCGGPNNNWLRFCADEKDVFSEIQNKCVHSPHGGCPTAEPGAARFPHSTTPKPKPKVHPHIDPPGDVLVSPDAFCHNKSPGKYPNTHNECSGYYVCGRKNSILSCKAGQIFSKAQGQCVPRTGNEGCPPDSVESHGQIHASPSHSATPKHGTHSSSTAQHVPKFVQHMMSSMPTDFLGMQNAGMDWMKWGLGWIPKGMDMMNMAMMPKAIKNPADIMRRMMNMPAMMQEWPGIMKNPAMMTRKCTCGKIKNFGGNFRFF